MPVENTLVTVRRQLNDKNLAIYRIFDIHDIHWARYTGGARLSLPRSELAGFVNCKLLIEGKLTHSCKHGQCPHTTKVLILKEDNSGVYTQLLRRAVLQPRLRGHR